MARVLALLTPFVENIIFTIDGAKMFVCSLQVFPFEQLERLRNLGEVYEPPEAKPFKPRVDPSSWLADEQHRDQFVLRYSEPHPSGKLVRVSAISVLCFNLCRYAFLLFFDERSFYRARHYRGVPFFTSSSHQFETSISRFRFLQLCQEIACLLPVHFFWANTSCFSTSGARGASNVVREAPSPNLVLRRGAREGGWKIMVR